MASATATVQASGGRGVITWFTIRRTRIGATAMGLVIAIGAAVQTLGIVKTYPTTAELTQFIETLRQSSGVAVLYGSTDYLTNTVGSYVAWRVLGSFAVIGAIWALAVATRSLRGEEDKGRWELLLTGSTTARRATASTLLGLYANIAAMYVIIAVCVVAIGSIPSVNISPHSSAFFALALVMAPLEFIAVGAFLSQLLPTRRAAARWAGIVLGVSFGLRAIASVSSDWVWLRNISPLGWVEQLQPMTGNDAIWLVPIIGFTVVLSLAAVYLAGKRDLGEGILADHDTARPRTLLLRSPFSFALRMTRMTVIGWAISAAIASLLLCSLAQSATSAVSSSSSLQTTFNKIVSDQAQLAAAQTFLGLIFLMLMIMVMAMAAIMVSSIREDEASGQLDNFLVGPVRRLQWLGGRVAIVVAAVAFVSAVMAAAGYLGVHNQNLGVSAHDLFLAGINMIAPCLFIIGAGVALLGFYPRATGLGLYVIIGWSFLAQMIGPIINAPDWVLNTSLLQHIALAPAVSPNWSAAAWLVGIGLVLGLGGALRFNRRDIEGE